MKYFKLPNNKTGFLKLSLSSDNHIVLWVDTNWRSDVPFKSPIIITDELIIYQNLLKESYIHLPKERA